MFINHKKLKSYVKKSFNNGYQYACEDILAHLLDMHQYHKEEAQFYLVISDELYEGHCEKARFYLELHNEIADIYYTHTDPHTEYINL